MRAQQAPSHIVSLLKKHGTEVTDGSDILDTLVRYFARLYISQCAGREEDLAHYLSQIPMSCISVESCQLLDKPIALEELEKALQMSPNDKAPRSVGLPDEFYKKYGEVFTAGAS